MKLFIQNMTCGGCARAVTAAVKSVDSQAAVNVNVADKLVEVTSSQPVQSILDALEAQGYPAEKRA